MKAKDQLTADDPAGWYLCHERLDDGLVRERPRYWTGLHFYDDNGMCMSSAGLSNFRGPLVCLDVEAAAEDIKTEAERLHMISPHRLPDLADIRPILRKYCGPAEPSDEDDPAAYRMRQTYEATAEPSEPAPQASEVESLRREVDGACERKPTLVEDYASTHGLEMLAVGIEESKRAVDLEVEVERLKAKLAARPTLSGLREWLLDPNRKPPSLAFTPGPERELADLICGRAAGPKLLTEGPLPEGHIALAIVKEAGYIALIQQGSIDGWRRVGAVIYHLPSPADWPQPQEKSK